MRADYRLISLPIPTVSSYLLFRLKADSFLVEFGGTLVGRLLKKHLYTRTGNGPLRYVIWRTHVQASHRYPLPYADRQLSAGMLYHDLHTGGQMLADPKARQRFLGRQTGGICPLSRRTKPPFVCLYAFVGLIPGCRMGALNAPSFRVCQCLPPRRQSATNLLFELSSMGFINLGRNIYRSGACHVFVRGNMLFSFVHRCSFHGGSGEPAAQREELELAS
ncbi:hypothetical protein B0H11DRAFT_1974814 [Mycena galericulata]|nr:hypothetical protein B0H11DRAFT_1974814 [Mycena galericulata]